MPYVASVGTYLPCWGTPLQRVAGDDEDAVTMAFSECARTVDKGLAKTDLQAAWFGAMGTADGFPSGILADMLGLPDLPVTRIELLRDQT